MKNKRVKKAKCKLYLTHKDKSFELVAAYKAYVGYDAEEHARREAFKAVCDRNSTSERGAYDFELWGKLRGKESLLYAFRMTVNIDWSDNGI